MTFGLLYRPLAEKASRFARSPVARNLLALYSVQGLQYLMPLVTLPWLVRSLGIDGYGILNFATAFGGYLQIVCDYGFGLTATQRISEHRDETERLEETIWAVVYAKFILGAIALACSMLAIRLIPALEPHSGLLMLGCAGALASSLLPSWLFQGKEEMGILALTAILSRIIQLGGILLLVHRPSDLPTALWLGFFVSLLGTVAMWVWAFHRFGICPRWPSFQAIRTILRDGFEVFLSQVGTLLFANTNIMVLGSVGSARDVGLYSIAEKVVRLGIQVGGPLGTAIFPRVAVLLRDSPRQGYLLLRKVLIGGTCVFCTISLGLVFAAPLAVRLVSGQASPEIVLIIRILSPLPLTIFLDNLFGTQILLNLGHRRLFMFGPITSGLVAVACQVSLVPIFHARGAAIALLLSEVWCLGYFGYFGWKVSGFPCLPQGDA